MEKIIKFIKKLKVWQIALISIALSTLIYMGAYFAFAPKNNTSCDSSSLVLDPMSRFDYTNDDNDTYAIQVFDYDLDNNNNKYFTNRVAIGKWSIFGQVAIKYDYYGTLNLFNTNNSSITQINTNLDIGINVSYNDNDLIIIDTYFSNNYWYCTFMSEYSYTLKENSYFTFVYGSSNPNFTLYTDVCFINIIMQLDRYQNGYQSGYQTGYNDGLQDGFTNLGEDTQEAYNNGLSVGYQTGYNDGLNSNENQSLRNMLLTIFDVPLIYVRELLDFELLGVNFFGLFGAIITLGIALWILQKVL